MDRQVRVKIAFQGEGHQNIRDHVDFGQLLSPLAAPLEHSGIEGRMKVEFQRTHEWEAELAILWFVAGAVAGGVCSQFGAKIADVIWEWGKTHVAKMKNGNKDITSKEELGTLLNFEVIAQAGNNQIDRQIVVVPRN